MLLLAVLCIELTLLFFLSKRLTQAIFECCLLIFHARSIAITILTLINFPGTVIHELSHLFTAEILGVRTGKLTLVPDSIQGNEIKTGSVMIAASDPFRRYFIGLAPIFTGLIAITTLSYFLSQHYYPITILTMVYFYLLLAVSNAMFSSAEDLKGFLPFILTLTLMVGAAYFAGFRIGLTGPALSIAIQILDGLTKSLGIVVGLNIISLILAKLCILFTQKITGRKLYKR